METFSALLALCAGNSLVTGEFPAQKPVTRSFHIFFDLRLNKRLNKQSWCWWFETPSCSLWRDIRYSCCMVKWCSSTNVPFSKRSPTVPGTVQTCRWDKDMALWKGMRSLRQQLDTVHAVGTRISMERPQTEVALWWRHQMNTFSALLSFVRGIYRSPVNFLHKGQWRGDLMFSLICAWINGE